MFHYIVHFLEYNHGLGNDFEQTLQAADKCHIYKQSIICSHIQNIVVG